MVSAKGEHIQKEPNLLNDSYFADIFNNTQADAQAPRADLKITSDKDKATPHIIYIDVVCTHPTGDSKAKDQPGFAATKAEKHKRDHYERLFNAERAKRILPLAVETYGRIGTESKEAIDLLAKKLGGSQPNELRRRL